MFPYVSEEPSASILKIEAADTCKILVNIRLYGVKSQKLPS
jgi:hypothetical protein